MRIFSRVLSKFVIIVKFIENFSVLVYNVAYYEKKGDYFGFI